MQIIMYSMHRSGSSVATRLFNMMGVYLGDEQQLMLPQADNKKGFWERQDVVNVNDFLLSAQQCSWYDVAGWDAQLLPEDEMDPVNLQIREIIHRIDSRRPWVIKDPRMCLTGSAWARFLEMPVHVFVNRDAMSIADSLKRRNGMPIEVGLALWEVYTVNALQQIKLYPNIFFNIEALMSNPGGQLKKIKQKLEDFGVGGLRMPSEKEIESFIDSAMIHQNSKHASLSQEQKTLVEVLESLCSGNTTEVPDVDLSVAATKILREYHKVAGSEDVIDGKTGQFEETLWNKIEKNGENLRHAISSQGIKIDELVELTSEQKRLVENQSLVIQQQKHEIDDFKRQVESLQEQLFSNQKVGVLLREFRASLLGRVYSIQERLYKMVTFRSNSNTALETIENHVFGEVQKLEAKKKNKITIFFELVAFAIKNPGLAIKLCSFKRLVALLKWFRRSEAIQIDEMLSTRMEVFNPEAGKAAIYQIDPLLLPEDIELPQFECVDVSIIVPVYNQWEHTINCLKSIEENTKGIRYEVILADDCSTDETENLAGKVKGLKHFRQDTNQRFVRNCNSAAEIATGSFLVLLNNDTLVEKGWLNHLLECFNSDPSVGMAGPKFIFPDGSVQEAGGIIWSDASGWNYGRGMDARRPEVNYLRPVDYLSGACIMLRKQLWQELGGFDDRYHPAYYEDTDLAFSVRKKGLRVVYQPQSVVVHFEGISHGTDLDSGLKAYQVENKNKFLEKWLDELSDRHFSNGESVFLARENPRPQRTILFIDHYIPHYDKDAGSRSTYQYIKLFVSEGCKVLFLGDNFYSHEPYTSHLRAMGVEVLTGAWYAKNWKEWLRAESQFIDCIYLHRPHITEHYIDFLNGLKHRPRLVYFGHDLHYLRAEREYELTKNPITKKEMQEWKVREFRIFGQVDCVLYPSKFEVEKIRSTAPDINVHQLPLNIYGDSFGPNTIGSFSSRQGLVFVGGFGHPPNADAIKWFVNEVFPSVREKIEGIKLTVIGSNTDKAIESLASDSVEILGSVSDEELEEAYKSARIAIVPLRFGAGVKGKVLEAFYLGIPVVTTGVGIEGIPVDEDYKNIADDAKQFLDCIERIYLQEEQWNEAVSVGREIIKNNFSYEHAKKMLGLFFV